eukprot:TRINITY_DN6585_c1_g1_i1.p1 TRINITY_DN6585_c1_g1~~TRINITY_DN6585_c1_g1_i1.p1  ORF type:complete len:119 (-),score=32.75 TRINITY_DN6585_c1_g1_i1:86-397(-)
MADENPGNSGKDAGNDGGDKPAGEHINLRVVAQDGSEVLFKIKRSTPLRKLMDAYCQKQSIAPTSLRFLFDGKRVQPDQSPQDIGMEDGDILDAVAQQTGGCF